MAPFGKEIKLFFLLYPKPRLEGLIQSQSTEAGFKRTLYADGLDVEKGVCFGMHKTPELWEKSKVNY